MNSSLKDNLKWLFSYLISVPGTAQSIQTKPRTSLCSLPGLYLPSGPHSLFLFEPFQHKTRNLCLLPAQTVYAKEGPLPGQVAVLRHRTVPPNSGLVNPESFMETSQYSGALPAWTYRTGTWMSAYRNGLLLPLPGSNIMTGLKFFTNYEIVAGVTTHWFSDVCHPDNTWRNNLKTEKELKNQIQN